jgi:hypothetical protein
LLRPGEHYQVHDRLYVPKVVNTTGDLDIHDIAVDDEGRLVLVATKFGCIEPNKGVSQNKGVRTRFEQRGQDPF